MTECTGIIKVSLFFLNIPGKIPLASTTIIFGSPSRKNKFKKDHCATWYDVIYLSALSDTIPNHVIQYRNVRILRDPYQSGMSSGSQNSIDTTSNGVSDFII